MFIKVILNKKSIAVLILAAVGVFLVYSAWQRVKVPPTVKVENNEQIVDYLYSQSLSVKEQPIYTKNIEITQQLVAQYPTLKPYQSQSATAVAFDMKESAEKQRVMVIVVRQGIVMYNVYNLQNAV